MTYILYNPHACGGSGFAGVQKAVDGLWPEKPAVRDITQTDIRPFLTGLGGEDKVILCGGDGTLHFLVNALGGAAPAVPVYVQWFGTGNDFLRDVGAKGRTGRARLNDYMRSLPQVEVNGETRRFLNNSSFGLDGQVCELGDEMRQKRKTKVSYVMLALRLVLGRYHWTDAAVTVDGETRRYKKVWIASALNGRYIGGGIKIAPGQNRMSDRLCCVVWHGTGRLGTLVRLPALLWGGHVKMKKHCDVFFAQDIAVAFDRPCAIQLDGEVISGVTRYRAWKGIETPGKTVDTGGML
ncbi:MAG: hypothetical protein LUG57_01950 [Oscillospiraceae bacterium]|nr:hypothetical protein [Oscillospiraceae bacterium]